MGQNSSKASIFHDHIIFRDQHANTSLFSLVSSTHGMGKATACLPEYLAAHGYREPTDGHDCPWQMAFNTKLHSFDYIHQDPELAPLFKNAVLSQPQARRAQWEQDPEFYPVQERLLTGFEPDAVLMVDVGGGMGLDCEFQRRLLCLVWDWSHSKQRTLR